MRLRAVATLSFAFTYFFFIEYLPPFRRVHIPYDLQAFHYPLADYAFQAVSHGRLPEWDPTIYCGLSFSGNIQAALFYPPTWLLFAVNIGRSALSYQSLQSFQLAHVWLAFILCYVWLRNKRLTELASVMGAGVFAYSGYMLNQLQHLGVVTAYAWMPLGLWSIDEATEQRRWLPLWKLAVASALTLLAGYPPTWFVFAVSAVSYAAWRWRAALGVVLALGASLLLAAIQLLPSRESTMMKAFEDRYGDGFRNPEAYISYFVPNYFDFGLSARPTHWAGDYLYLGAPAFLGVIVLTRRRSRRDLVPCLSILVVSLIFALNPFGVVSAIMPHFKLLAQICRDWYFLAGITLAAAALAAIGLDNCLRHVRPVSPRWLVLVIIAALGGWSAHQLVLWSQGGSEFPTGWTSAIDAAITLSLFSAAVILLPAQRGALRAVLLTMLLLTVAVDYKVYGTSRWFDAEAGAARTTYGPSSFPAMDAGVYGQLRASSEYRIAVDITGPVPTELRHYGLTAPQGFDPFLTTQYQKLMTKMEHFRSNWLIDIDPAHEAALRLLGVRYFITAESAPLYSRLSTSPSFHLLEPSRGFYKVFEFAKARPPYGWLAETDANKVQRVRWTPEAREFVVRSETGGRFVLAEQFFPGWQATLDGNLIRIERWSEAFQAVQVPPGTHVLAFRFRSSGLRLGALVSSAAMIALAIFVWTSRKPLADESPDETG